jgi:hypothetical protein
VRFRKDGTGYYNRSAVPGQGRPVAEKLLFKLEGSVLQLKMAHAAAGCRWRPR